MAEILALLAICLLAIALTRAWRLAIAIAALVLVLAALRPAPAASHEPVRRGTTIGYVTSSACLGCHPAEHASFARTFHRTMTQVASRTTVPRGGPFQTRGDDVFFDDRRVTLVTGSHREQAFWTGDDIVPFVYSVRDKAFLPREEAFITPPGEELPTVHWRSNCIACHTVAGEPEGPRVAELGVACEACHGPGAAHVDRHRDPFTRYAQHGRPDPSVVLPTRLSAERSTAVCGQCHAYAYPRDENAWWATGYARSYRAGELLAPSRIVLDANRITKHVDVPASSIFWPDGSSRVGGREYNSFVLSKCHQKGGLTCVSSCHSMHRGEPAGQIDPELKGDRQCTTCHTNKDKSHTHHSSNLECVDCHMPKTSYALFEGVRSHRIDSPQLPSSKPNACNLCHLDKSLAWTMQRLGQWYGQPITQQSEHQVGIQDGLLAEAGIRALVADALVKSQGPLSWKCGVLTQMKEDPYAIVRRIADRSLRTLPEAPAEPLHVDVATRDNRPILIAE